MRSPGGSTFPYPYLGGEIHCLKYGGRADDVGGLEELMAEELAFVESTHQAQRIWVDLYGTRLSGPACDLLVRHLAALRPRLVRLALVGCAPTGRLRLRAAARRLSLGLPAPTRFYSDPEVAKTWLVRG